MKKINFFKTAVFFALSTQLSFAEVVITDVDNNIRSITTLTDSSIISNSKNYLSLVPETKTKENYSINYQDASSKVVTSNMNIHATGDEISYTGNKGESLENSITYTGNKETSKIIIVNPISDVDVDINKSDSLTVVPGKSIGEKVLIDDNNMVSKGNIIAIPKMDDSSKFEKGIKDNSQSIKKAQVNIQKNAKAIKNVVIEANNNKKVASDTQSLIMKQDKIIKENSQRIVKLENQKHEDICKESRAGIAGALATAQITPVPNHKLTVGAGVGTYRGESAVALGVKYLPKDNVIFSLSGSADTRSGVGAATGVSFGF